MRQERQTSPSCVLPALTCRPTTHNTNMKQGRQHSVLLLLHAQSVSQSVSHLSVTTHKRVRTYIHTVLDGGLTFWACLLTVRFLWRCQSSAALAGLGGRRPRRYTVFRRPPGRHLLGSWHRIRLQHDGAQFSFKPAPFRADGVDIDIDIDIGIGIGIGTGIGSHGGRCHRRGRPHVSLRSRLRLRLKLRLCLCLCCVWRLRTSRVKRAVGLGRGNRCRAGGGADDTGGATGHEGHVRCITSTLPLLANLQERTVKRYQTNKRNEVWVVSVHKVECAKARSLARHKLTCLRNWSSSWRAAASSMVVRASSVAFSSLWSSGRTQR